MLVGKTVADLIFTYLFSWWTDSQAVASGIGSICVIGGIVLACIRPVDMIVQATAIIGGGLIYDGIYYAFYDVLSKSDLYLYLGHLLVPLFAISGYYGQKYLGYLNKDKDNAFVAQV